MATFWATFANVDNRAKSGGTPPVLQGRGSLGLTPLTTTGASGIMQRSSTDWIAPRSGNVTLRGSAAAWVQIAAVPEAAPGADLYIALGERIAETSIPNKPGANNQRATRYRSARFCKLCRKTAGVRWCSQCMRWLCPECKGKRCPEHGDKVSGAS